MSSPSQQEIHVGIDVSKKTLDVYILPSEGKGGSQGESFVVTNDQEGIDELLRRLAEPGLSPKLVVLEAT